MDYAAYDQTLLGHMWFYIVLGLLGAGLCVGAFLYLRNERRIEGKKDKVMSFLVGRWPS